MSTHIKFACHGSTRRPHPVYTVSILVTSPTHPVYTVSILVTSPTPKCPLCGAAMRAFR